MRPWLHQSLRYAEILADVPPLGVPAFPQVVSLIVAHGGYALHIHYWIPTAEAADLMASGSW